MKKPNFDSACAKFRDLLELISKLRDPQGGCPWDLEQTHQTLRPYVIEEAYEVVEAIDGGHDTLPEELGDLLLQVVLHAQIGTDSGIFSIENVIDNLSTKLIARHPHVFGDHKASTSKEVLENWERIKKDAKGSKTGMLDGLPKSLPALLKAHRIGEKVGRVGFDWESAAQITHKINEEIKELQQAQSLADSGKIAEEFGDLLFTLAQWARKSGMNAEEALSKANDKFKRRFAKMEALSHGDLAELDEGALQDLWEQAKNLV